MSASARLLAAACLLAGACGREIDSRPEAGSREARAAVPAAAAAPATAGDDDARAASEPAAVPAPDGYRTHLYSERDADVHALLDDNTSLGATGTVEALRAEIGDRVRRGEVLALLDDARPTLAVRAAQARADELRAQLERTTQLLEKGFATAAEHERLTHALVEATADLEQAQLDLSRTRVVAPFAGVVARRYVRVGERVDVSTPLFRVTAMSPLRARLLVPERRAAVFPRGAPVAVRTVAGARARGRVVLVSPTVDPGSGTREVIVEVPGGDGLLPGGEVLVAPESGEAPPAAPVVPLGERAGPPE